MLHDHMPSLSDEQVAHYTIIMQSAVFVGIAFGGYLPARKAAYQYYAEHQHCLPRTRSEHQWYVKKRNYKVMHAFMRNGIVKGMQTGLIGAVWCVMDYLICDHVNVVLAETGKGVVAGSLLGLAGKGHRLYYTLNGVRLGAGCGIMLGMTKLLLTPGLLNKS